MKDSYSFYALFSVLIFSFIHLFAQKFEFLKLQTKSKLLSFGGGVAISYVFVDLLPKLCLNDQLIGQNVLQFFPYLEKHVFIMALTGFLLFFAVDRGNTFLKGENTFYFSLSSYALFNFIVGYAVVDPHDPEVQPLALFTFAMALHYLTNDFSLTENHPEKYQSMGKYLLVLALLLGWVTGLFLTLSKTAIALIGSFIGGGIIMNVIRHELPQKNPNNFSAFLVGALFYTIVLLI